MSVVDKIKAKVENVLHSNDHSTTHGGVSGTGPHSSSTANKADPRVDSDRDGSTNFGAAQTGPGGAYNNTTTSSGIGGIGGTSGHHSTNAGPHSSNIANKLDPRVDSDRDGSTNYGAAQSGPGGAYNTTTGTGVGGNYSTNAGPHSSNLANKLDPRVDSDRDGSTNYGAAQSGPGGAYNTATGTGVGGNHSTNAGPHSSNLANKLDPRVDSDRDGSTNYGAAQSGPGGAYNNTSGSGFGSGTHANNGPHNSSLLNKLDPRVDSDNDGSRNVGLAQTGEGSRYTSNTGPATGTAGPHSSNIANKLDPSVNSTNTSNFSNNAPSNY